MANKRKNEVTPKSDRHEVLRQYFIAVLRDLVARGVLRRKFGQSLDQILAAEAGRLLVELEADLVEVLKEVGEDLRDAALGQIKQLGLELVGQVFFGRYGR